jgi:hypothetical protein
MIFADHDGVAVCSDCLVYMRNRRQIKQRVAQTLHVGRKHEGVLEMV